MLSKDSIAGGQVIHVAIGRFPVLADARERGPFAAVNSVMVKELRMDRSTVRTILKTV